VSDPTPWEVLKSETLLNHAPWLSVIRQSVRLPDGAVMDDYWLTPGRDFSMVLALTAQQEVLLVQQYKHGLGRALLEFPAGYLDSAAEEPLACAQRELREETGFQAAEWQSLGAFALDPNRSDNLAHFFLAHGLLRVSDPEPDATESLRHLVVPLHDVPQLLRNGAMPSLACAGIWGAAAGVIFAAS
jgi:ADP-ribose pyrophosphatase